MSRPTVHIVVHGGFVSSVYSKRSDAEERAAEIRAEEGGEKAWTKVSDEEWIKGNYVLQVETWVVK